MIIEQVAVIPSVVVVVQLLKPFKGYYKFSSIIAFIVAFLGTVGVVLYNMTADAFYGMGTYELVRFFIECFFTAVATWLSASKVYDMSIGDKKNKKEVQQKLEDEFVKGVVVGKNGGV